MWWIFVLLSSHTISNALHSAPVLWFSNLRATNCCIRFFIILPLKEHAQDCNTITIAKRKPRHYASFILIKLYTLPHSLNILSHSCELNASTRNTNKILYPSSFPLCNMCRADTMTHYKNLWDLFMIFKNFKHLFSLEAKCFISKSTSTFIWWENFFFHRDCS